MTNVSLIQDKTIFTIEDYKRLNNYQANLKKFVFQESKNITHKEYIKLTDEIREVNDYLKREENKTNSNYENR